MGISIYKYEQWTCFDFVFTNFICLSQIDRKYWVIRINPYGRPTNWQIFVKFLLRNQCNTVSRNSNGKIHSKFLVKFWYQLHKHDLLIARVIIIHSSKSQPWGTQMMNMCSKLQKSQISTKPNQNLPKFSKSYRTLMTKS